MIVRMIYVLPMILGRTFHVGKNTVGVDIFNPEDVNNSTIRLETSYHANYKTIEFAKDVKDILQIDGALGLNIKSGLFAIRGFGAYVKSAIRSENSVDVMTKVRFRTISKSLKDSVRPVAHWKQFGKDHLGTHYVKSILYGGDLIACIRFKAMHVEDLEEIRATIKTSLAGGNALDLFGGGELESLDRELKKKATMEINYFATVPIEGVPNTIKGLKDLIEGFENHVKKVNNGIGVPVEVELDELSFFDRGFEYIKNTDLETELEFFQESLDDLLRSKALLKKWVEEFPDPFTKTQMKEISGFSNRVAKVLRKFTATLGNLNFEKDSSQLDEAKAAYEEDGLGFTGKFRRDFIKLSKKIVPSGDYSDKYSSVYVHYGSSNCSLEKSTVLLYSGYVASSPRNQIGGGVSYLCMPEVPISTISEGDEEEVGRLSLISGVKYGLMETNPAKIHDDKSVLRGVMCAMCLVQRQALFTFHGTTECPEKGGWTIQYAGYLMAATDIERAEHVCVDPKEESNRLNYMGPHDQSLNYVLFKKPDGQYGFVSCVVCSK